MHLMRWHDVRDVDLPYIEAPFAATSKVESLLRNEGVSHLALDRLGSEMGLSFMADKARLHRHILEGVRHGELCLAVDGGLDRPFSPLAEWTGNQWRPHPSAWHPGPSLTAKVAQLNARGLTPGEVRNARWPASAATSSHPAPTPPERSPEPIVEPPVVTEPGFHIVRTSGTRDQIKRRLFPYTLTPDTEAMFERLNPHLGDYVLPGDMVVLADPRSQECREDEEFLMAEARAIQGTLAPLEATQRQSLMDHWQAYEDIALAEEAAAPSATLSNASTAVGATSAAGSRAISEAKQALEAIDGLYQQAMDPANAMTRAEFFSLREQRFKRLSLVMNNWVNAPLRLPRHPELKTRINVEARQQLHSVDTARSGGKFRIPSISEAITRTTLVARLTSIGSFVGIGFDALATQATIESACTEGSDNECRKIKYVEYGGLSGRVAASAAGGAIGGTMSSRFCLGMSLAPQGRLACGIVGAASGSYAGTESGDFGGKELGTFLHELLYGVTSQNESD